MRKALALTLFALLGACAGTTTGVEYAGTVTVSSPELVTIDQPDVYVVADADQPVFYTDNVYWLYSDGYWYRSPRYDRGWVRIDSPPVRLRHIDQPTAYVHYRARAQTARNQRTTPDRNEPRPSDQIRSPRQQPQPMQPTEPAQPPVANPRPPQQEPPVIPDTRNLTPDQAAHDRAQPPDDRGVRADTDDKAKDNDSNRDKDKDKKKPKKDERGRDRDR